MKFEKNEKIKYLKYFIITIIALCLFSFLIMPYLLVPFMDNYASFMTKYIVNPIGISGLPDPFRVPISVFILMIPVVSIIFLYIVLSHYVPRTDRHNRANIQLERIKLAKESLRDSITYLDELKRSIAEKAIKYTQLEELVDQLDSASKESEANLRSKLNAISYVNRKTMIIKYAISFALGVMASLMASSIRDFLLK